MKVLISCYDLKYFGKTPIKLSIFSTNCLRPIWTKCHVYRKAMEKEWGKVVTLLCFLMKLSEKQFPWFWSQQTFLDVLKHDLISHKIRFWFLFNRPRYLRFFCLYHTKKQMTSTKSFDKVSNNNLFVVIHKQFRSEIYSILFSDLAEKVLKFHDGKVIVMIIRNFSSL